MSTAVIQGASGGIGKPLVRFLLTNTNLRVVGLTSKSNAASALQDEIARGLDKDDVKNRLRIVDSVDLLHEDKIERARKEAEEYMKGEKDVRLLVCLAGELHPEKSLKAVDVQQALGTFHKNSLAHLALYKHFLPLIPTASQYAKLPFVASSSSFTAKTERGNSDPAKGWVRAGGSTIVSLSARVGSIGDNEKGGWYSYRASKAALNQIIRTLDHELYLKKSSALALAYHPGTTLTTFTQPVIGSPAPDESKGIFTAEDSVKKLMSLVKGARRKEEKGQEDGADFGGGFWDWKGDKVPW